MRMRGSRGVSHLQGGCATAHPACQAQQQSNHPAKRLTCALAHVDVVEGVPQAILHRPELQCSGELNQSAAQHSCL